ncbi:oxidoreductase [Cryptococcus neoformans Bt1]|nr:oxidoreductase [Cryptococcus neoformans var. grubii Bt1]
MAKSAMRTVVVLGASYGGCPAIKILAEKLPRNYKLIAIDRNTHMNHVYTFSRFTVKTKHAPKGFIPYKHLLDPQPKHAPEIDLSTPPETPPIHPFVLNQEDEVLAGRARHQFIQGVVTKLSSKEITFVRPSEEARPDFKGVAATNVDSKGTNMTYGEFDGPEEKIEYDYLLYALGSTLPDPVNVWKPLRGQPRITGEERKLGSKKHGLRFMAFQSEKFKAANKILIVGGGALGIQYATDLKDVYPEKKVTLLHSRTRLLPIYPIKLHVKVMETLTKMGVDVVLGERVMTWPDEPEVLDGKIKYVTTDKGRTFKADIVLPCTGQRPNVSLMAQLDPALISPATGRIRVLPTQQVRLSRPASVENTDKQLAKSSIPTVTPPLTPSPATFNGSDEAQLQTQKNYNHIFAIGDCAQTKAIQAGHTAFGQGEVAARNILRLIAKEEGEVEKINDGELEEYEAPKPAIKLTLGIKNGVLVDGESVTPSDTGEEDLHALLMWGLPNAMGMDIDE